MSRLLLACAALALVSCSPPNEAKRAESPAAVAARVATDVPAGAYAVDKIHSSLIFRANHLGFANFTARFTEWDAQLELDPANPAAASVNVTINPASFASDHAPEDFLATMLGPQFFDVERYPQVTFRSTRIDLTSPTTATINGELTMHGVTRPIALEATFNGGYAGHPLDPNARIGFSARGTVKRSEFDMGFGTPPPDSNMGVSDDVEIIIEAEFIGPAWLQQEQALATP